jgi:hypothetical protein
MDIDSLQNMPRKDLQDLAKKFGLKANKKSADLIADLTSLLQTPVSEEVVTNDIIADESQTLDTMAKVAEAVEHKELSIKDLEIGMAAKFQTHEDTHFGTVKRLNKKSLRILQDDGSEVTLQHDDITRIHSSDFSEMAEVPEVVSSAMYEAPPAVEEVITEEKLEFVEMPEVSIAVTDTTVSVAKVAEAVEHKELSIKDLEIGMAAKFQTYEDTHFGTVKRLNKKSLRIVQDDGSEVTLQHDDITRIHSSDFSEVAEVPEVVSSAMDEAPPAVEEVVLVNQAEEEEPTAAEAVNDDMEEETETDEGTVPDVIESVEAAGPFAVKHEEEGEEEEVLDVSGMTEEDEEPLNVTQLSPIQEICIVSSLCAV